MNKHNTVNLVNFALVYGNFSNVSIHRVKFEFRVTSVIYFDVNGRIRLGNFVEHFDSVEHISYSTGTSRNSVEHKRCQEKCL